jgi:hypothetical protein
VDPASLLGLAKRAMSPISAAMVDPSTQAIPGAVMSSGTQGVVGAQPAQLALAAVDLGVQVVDQAHRRGGGPAHGSGRSRRASSCRPPGPNRSAVGHGRPNANSVACTRFFSAVR